MSRDTTKDSNEVGKLVVPEEWSTFDEEVDRGITDKAIEAKKSIDDAKEDKATVKHVLANFLAGWKILVDSNPDLSDTQAAEKVREFFDDLAKYSGSSVDPSSLWHEISMGMHDLEVVDTDSFLSEVAKKHGAEQESFSNILDIFTKEVQNRLKSSGRAKIPGFGSFFTSERTFHNRKKGLEAKPCVNFRCSTAVKKVLPRPEDFHPTALAKSDFISSMAQNSDLEQDYISEKMEHLKTSI